MSDVEAVIADAWRRIGARGEVSYPARVAVRRALVGRGGQLAWARLERLSALLVKPHWSVGVLTEEGPWELLDDAFAACERGETVADARARFGHWWSFLDSAVIVASDFRPTYAGRAALAAAAAALWPTEEPEASSELDLDPDGWDASFWASIAEAGGATWEVGVGDDARRAKFWEWWVRTAESVAARPQSRGEAQTLG